MTSPVIAIVPWDNREIPVLPMVIVVQIVAKASEGPNCASKFSPKCKESVGVLYPFG